MKKIITNFALDLDEKTKEQFDSCCSQKFIKKAALMPDAHCGYVAPIGAVLVTTDYVVPSWVGYDIGCGMIALEFKKKGIIQKIQINKEEIYRQVNMKVPMGKGRVNHIKEISMKTKIEFKKLLQKFTEKEHKEEIYRYLRNKALSPLGSLGSGNHFIELGKEENNNDSLWLIIHSGSRGVGHTIATYYMKEASKKIKEYENTYPIKVSSETGKEYLNVLDFGLEFALLNRLEIAYKIRDVLKEVLKDETLDFGLWVNKNHNHAILENDNYIHRKGATPAKKGERGVIPANMKEGSFLVEGLGNKEFLESSSHGAGRVLSRTQARKEIKKEDFEREMKGIVGTVNEKTIDEAPQAYKNIYDVMDKQKKSVKILKHIKPIINWKGE